MADFNTNAKKFLPQLLNEFRYALESEIRAIEKYGQTSTLLTTGKLMGNNDGHLLYTFRVQYAPIIPEDTPCKLTVGREKFTVTVVRFTEFEITISSSIPLPENLGKAYLENGSTALLKRLISCIEEDSEKENPVARRMLRLDEQTFNKIHTNNEIEYDLNNNDAQNSAICSALSNNLTYIWGPPGTGKTQVIGQIIRELYRKNRSVLVVSHTNTAVNGALSRADNYLRKDINSGNYPILKVGTGATENLPNRARLQNHMDASGKELYVTKKRLEEEKRSLSARMAEIEPIISTYESKSKWISQSKLTEAQELKNEVKALREKTDALNESEIILRDEIASEREKNPEYDIFLAAKQRGKIAVSEYKQLENRIVETQKSLAALGEQAEEARNEAAKFDVYDRLRQEESTLMSEEFLRGELSTVGDEIRDIQNQLTNIGGQETAANKRIAEYEAKSSFARFLSGKSSVVAAQNTLARLQAQRDKLAESLNVACELERSYKLQLNHKLAIAEQLKRIKLKKSQEFWKHKHHECERKQLELSEAAESMQIKKTELFKEIKSLADKIHSMQPSFEKIVELESRLNELSGEKKEITAHLNDKLNLLSSVLEVEIEHSREFIFLPENAPLEEICELLRCEYGRIEEEIFSIDFSALEDEYQRLKTQISELQKQISAIEQALNELERHIILSTPIIGATLTKTYLTGPLRERVFDTVILDEASMASIPALWCACHLAKSNAVIVGDFLQLPPIVVSKDAMAKKWLSKDVFMQSGVQRLVKDGRAPANFFALTDQYRMEREIADIANIYYGAYHRLNTPPQPGRTEERSNFYNWFPLNPGRHCMHMVDTESLHSWATGVKQGAGHSRLNFISAAVDIALAFGFAEKLMNSQPKRSDEAKILIVAPYKPHVALLNSLIRLEFRNRGIDDDCGLIRAGTVHSFQGSEADVVIYDLVVDEPHWKAGVFMPDDEINEGLRKAFNVAVTRAKFKLYVVGDFSFCRKRAKNNALSQFLDYLFNDLNLEKEEARALLPNLSLSNYIDVTANDNINWSESMFCAESSFFKMFASDIRNFKKRMIIYSPFMTEKRLSTLMPLFQEAVNLGRQIIIVTKSRNNRGKRELAGYIRCEEQLEKIGVKIVYKGDMHEKLIVIDDNVLWNGSLNALSFTGNTGEVMQRMKSHEVVSSAIKVIGVEYIDAATSNEYERTCPACGGTMILRESDNGGLYWQCEKKDFSRNADQPYPTDGVILCRKCGAEYVFSMKNTPRWVCTANPKHWRKVYEGDLKLPGMAAKIPARSLPAVEKFLKSETGSKKPLKKAEAGAGQTSLFQ